MKYKNFLKCEIWIKIEEMGPFLVKSWRFKKKGYNPCLSAKSGPNELKIWLVPFFDMGFQKKKTLKAEIRISIFQNWVGFSDSAT